MAPTQASNDSSKRMPGTLKKLPPIPKGGKVQKRPLTRRQPPASTKSRIIYVSSSTPFMSAVKRARKQLDASLKRQATAAPKNASLHARIEGLKRRAGDGVDSALVKVMGTGRAIEKVLSVASWFEQQDDCHVEVRTATVGTVDDVVVEDEDVEDVSRLRKMSCLEVSIKLK